MDTQKIIDKINELPVEQRAEIATQILEGLNPASDPEIEAAWMKEVERRAAEIDAGEAKMIPGEEAMERLRKITQK